MKLIGFLLRVTFFFGIFGLAGISNCYAVSVTAPSVEKLMKQSAGEVTVTIGIGPVECIHKCDEDINTYGAKGVGIVAFSCGSSNLFSCASQGIVQYNYTHPFGCENLDDCSQKTLAAYPSVTFKPLQINSFYTPYFCLQIYYIINNDKNEEAQYFKCIDNTLIPDTACSFEQENYVINYGRIELNEVEDKEGNVDINVNCDAGGQVNLSWTPLMMEGKEIATLSINNESHSGIDLEMKTGTNIINVISTLKKIDVGSFSAASVLTMSYP